MQTLGLYIHIPFCKSKCIYCDFASFALGQVHQDKYTSFLIKEINQVKSYGYNIGKTVDTIYFGGGTPGLLPIENIKNILESVKSNFDCDIKELTIEVNPDSQTLEKLQSYKDMGCNRLSFGVQTLNDQSLCKLGRLHTGEQAIECVKMAKDLGMNVSVDMLIGIPWQTKEDIDIFIDTFSGIGVQHISTYILKVEENTYLHKAVTSKKITMLDEDLCMDMYDYCNNKLQLLGYERYEISNFCLEGNQSKHNLKYWQRKDYLGLGISAHSMLGNKRFFNASNMQEYYSRIEGNLTYCIEENLSLDEMLFEEIMLGLRLAVGIDIDMLNKKYDIDFMTKFATALEKNKKYLNIDKTTIKIQPKYLAVMNSIISSFF